MITRDGVEIEFAISQVDKRIKDLENVNLGNDADISGLQKRIEGTLKDILDATTFVEYRGASFISGGPIRMGIGRMPRIEALPYREESRDNNIATLKALRDRLRDHALHRSAVRPQIAAGDQQPLVRSNKIFVVHGHTREYESVARFLEKLDLIPIVLHEQTNQGRTIIEKLEQHTNVGFAVILLTPDDECAAGGTTTKRARQNVILEWGYFIGKLGRARVCALKQGTVELPSDIQGIAWTDMDPKGTWKLELARELRDVGYSIDMNKV
jgi:predicted nucleotide-binding protein